MEAGRDAGPAVTGERDQESLESAIRFFRREGYPVSIADGRISKCGHSDVWAALREYFQLDDAARIQNETRESRAVSLEG